MKKSLLYIMLIVALCSSQAYAEESSNTGVDSNSAAVESYLLGETKTETSTSTATDTATITETSTETATATNTATVTSTSTATSTDTNTASSTATVTNTSTSTSTDSTSTGSSASASSPFAEDKPVNATVTVEAPSIADIDTAKICGIEKIEEGYPKEGTIVGVEGSSLRLRSWPWGNVIGNYFNGQSVKVLGTSGEFYLVDIDGTQGYMHKNYVSTPDKAGSGVDPYYPGDTRNGGALSKEDGVKASKDGAEGKIPTVTSGGTPGTVTISGDKVVLDVPKNYQGTVNTPAPWSSCGPTSLSMVLGFYGKGDPAVTVTDLYRISGCTQANGTGHDGLAKAAKQYGMTNAQWHYSVNQDFCRQQLKAGKPMICHVKGHYVVMKGMDANGTVILNDPAWKGVERTMSWSEFVAWWKQSNAPMSCMTC